MHPIPKNSEITFQVMYSSSVTNMKNTIFNNNPKTGNSFYEHVQTKFTQNYLYVKEKLML